jgi:membrane associated rhomboid family serine protease
MFRRDPAAVGVRADAGIAGMVIGGLTGPVSARRKRQRGRGAPARLDAP